jgi:hypothetical protein
LNFNIKIIIMIIIKKSEIQIKIKGIKMNHTSSIITSLSEPMAQQLENTVNVYVAPRVEANLRGHMVVPVGANATESLSSSSSSTSLLTDISLVERCQFTSNARLLLGSQPTGDLTAPVSTATPQQPVTTFSSPSNPVEVEPSISTPASNGHLESPPTTTESCLTTTITTTTSPEPTMLITSSTSSNIVQSEPPSHLASVESGHGSNGDVSATGKEIAVIPHPLPNTTPPSPNKTVSRVPNDKWTGPALVVGVWQPGIPNEVVTLALNADSLERYNEYLADSNFHPDFKGDFMEIPEETIGLRKYTRIVFHGVCPVAIAMGAKPCAANEEYPALIDPRHLAWKVKRLIAGGFVFFRHCEETADLSGTENRERREYFIKCMEEVGGRLMRREDLHPPVLIAQHAPDPSIPDPAPKTPRKWEPENGGMIFFMS